MSRAPNQSAPCAVEAAPGGVAGAVAGSRWPSVLKLLCVSAAPSNQIARIEQGFSCKLSCKRSRQSLPRGSALHDFAFSVFLCATMVLFAALSAPSDWADSSIVWKVKAPSCESRMLPRGQMSVAQSSNQAHNVLLCMTGMADTLTLPQTAPDTQTAIAVESAASGAAAKALIGEFHGTFKPTRISLGYRLGMAVVFVGIVLLLVVDLGIIILSTYGISYHLTQHSAISTFSAISRSLFI